MKKRELLAKIEDLQRRVADLESRMPIYTYWPYQPYAEPTITLTSKTGGYEFHAPESYKAVDDDLLGLQN
jgi:hypothetical protein